MPHTPNYQPASVPIPSTFPKWINNLCVYPRPPPSPLTPHPRPHGPFSVLDPIFPGYLKDRTISSSHTPPPPHLRTGSLLYWIYFRLKKKKAYLGLISFPNSTHFSAPFFHKRTVYTCYLQLPPQLLPSLEANPVTPSLNATSCFCQGRQLTLLVAEL